MSDRAEREKQLDWLYRLKSDLKIFIPKDFHLAEFEQSLDYAISSIKADLKYDLLYEETTHIADTDKMIEPTIKDCISRVEARKAILDHQYSDSFCEEHNIDHSINTGMALIALSDLPSVIPQETKTGHWNEIPKYKDIAWRCSECEHFTTMKHNYCPNCGAKMVEPQESEEV